jgi:AraC-like DNA-binding protein
LRAKQYIHEKIGEDISLREVARKVNTSSYYLCKQFKKSTGLSYTEYVSRIRIHKAKRLLKSPEVRVSEVAFQVGFQSLTHFNRVFKKFTGHSPTEFRSLTEMAA